MHVIEAIRRTHESSAHIDNLNGRRTSIMAPTSVACTITSAARQYGRCARAHTPHQLSRNEWQFNMRIDGYTLIRKFPRIRLRLSTGTWMIAHHQQCGLVVIWSPPASNVHNYYLCVSGQICLLIWIRHGWPGSDMRFHQLEFEIISNNYPHVKVVC